MMRQRNDSAQDAKTAARSVVVEDSDVVGTAGL
jgi:hypothetical protein